MLNALNEYPISLLIPLLRHVELMPSSESAAAAAADVVLVIHSFCFRLALLGEMKKHQILSKVNCALSTDALLFPLQSYHIKPFHIFNAFSMIRMFAAPNGIWSVYIMLYVRELVRYVFQFNFPFWNPFLVENPMIRLLDAKALKTLS